MSGHTEAEDRATLLTCDGRGKAAKEAALHRLIVNQLHSTVMRDARTLIAVVGADGDGAEIGRLTSELNDARGQIAALLAGKSSVATVGV